MEWLIFAQAAESLAGSSGWAGAGLLGLVLAVLFFKILPDLLNRHDAQQKYLTEKFEASLHKITEHCEKENDDLSREMSQITLAVQDLSEFLSRDQSHDASAKPHKKTMKADE